MKTKYVPGEFAFKALYNTPDSFGWILTESYFFSQKEVMTVLNKENVIWPVEELDNGGIYVPAQEELE